MKMFLIILSATLHSLPLLSMNFNNDLWTKIIACSSPKTKETIGKSCTTLHKLCSKNNQDIYVQSPLNLTTRQKEYALTYCIYKNCTAAVKNLLHHDAYSGYVYCGMDTTPLGIAKHNNNEELIKLLEDNDEYFENNRFIVPYALAAYMGDVETLRDYIKCDNYDPLYKNKDARWEGSTLLYPAIWNGHRDVVELLLTNPQTTAFINSGLLDSGRPIDAALIHGHTDIAERLLAIPSLTFNEHSCMQKLYHCAKSGYSGCVKILLKRNKKSRCINRLHHHNLQNIQEEIGIGSLHLSYCLLSPLAIAALNGHKRVVNHLLRFKKINVNAPVCRKKSSDVYVTPLYAASLSGNTTIVKRLLQCPDIDPLLYVKNCIPLHIACQKGYLRIVQSLIEHSPQSLQVKTKNTNQSPLELAQHYNHPKIVKLLC